MGLLMMNRILIRYGALSQLSHLAECVPCLGVMGMYLEYVMSRVPRSPHSLQALLLSHTNSLDLPKLLFFLL